MTGVNRSAHRLLQVLPDRRVDASLEAGSSFQHAGKVAPFDASDLLVGGHCELARHNSAGEVDQVTLGGGVNAITEPARHLDGQPDLLANLSDRSLLGRLARLDVAARPRPLGAPSRCRRRTMRSRPSWTM